MEKKKANKRISAKTKFILIGLGVVALTGTALYFYNRHIKGKPNNSTDFLDRLESETSLPMPPAINRVNEKIQTDVTKVKTAGSFPLKRGSKGELVRLVQLALIKKYGKEVLPKYGADGDFGTETANALIANGYPTEIDKSTFTKFIGQGVAESFGISGLSGNAQLKTIRDTRVWNVAGHKLPIPKGTIIGELIHSQKGVTQFQTLDNRQLFILTSAITYV